MKILHCADIHLDTPFGNIFSVEKSAVRKQEILYSFINMVKYASENGVRVIMITGDLLDSKSIAQKTIDELFDCIQKNPGIDFIFLPGSSSENEYVDHLENKPANLKLFDEDVREYRYGSCVIHGAAVPEKLPLLNDGDLNIVMTYGRIKFSEWKYRNIDYLAAGGIHTYTAGELDNRGVYCYPGSLEALSFDEAGTKGFMEIDTDGDKIEPQFVRSGKRVVYDINIDITGYKNDEEIEKLIKENIVGLDGSSMIKIILRGTVELGSVRNLDDIEAQLSKNYFGFVISDDELRLALDVDSYKFDKTLKGEFIRLVLSGEEDDEERKAIIETGLKALSGGDL